MKIYILDASVVLMALLGKEEKVAKTLKRIFKEAQRNKTKVYSSILLPLEVANGLRFTLKEEEKSREIYEKFALLPINYFSLNPGHIETILSLSYEFKTTVYDTSYHFLAKLLRGVFLTADREYFQKAKSQGAIQLIS